MTFLKLGYRASQKHFRDLISATGVDGFLSRIDLIIFRVLSKFNLPLTLKINDKRFETNRV